MKTRALIIEDNADFAQIFGHLLEVMGCEIDVAPNAETGLRLADELHPDIVFCDISLGGQMDGFSFAQEFRANALSADIPLIAVTGHTDTDSKERVLRSGFNKMLPKPVKFIDVKNVLSDLRK